MIRLIPNSLAHWHPRWVYRTLMQYMAATLTEFATNPHWLGATGSGRALEDEG